MFLLNYLPMYGVVNGNGSKRKVKLMHRSYNLRQGKSDMLAEGCELTIIEDKIKSNLMTMDPRSAPGPDEFTTKFYQACKYSIHDD
ncbi:hypothetical protein KY290_013611 [Solanum tuberosum]|uniref:Uncharacterized protein n=1 Tax=Solanum tuberosum TaxID=4113 RepID=A0ABQ7VM79_SOLTU|nr:hypothetical protein KY289_013738 [Solanum tuberosum]KAH0769630.1 hypothetical protein KY290_013611 [Solanum tuberosum]